jgi:hypothetical protein
MGAQTVSLTIKEEPLRDVLARLLTPRGLVYRAQHDVLYVTLKDSEAQLLGRIYPVRDLIDPQGTQEQIFWKINGLDSPLLEMVQLAPENEFADDYHSTMQLAHIDSVDALVVVAPHAAQEMIQSLLAQIRSERRPLDLKQHERQLQAARQGPVTLTYGWMGYQGAPVDFDVESARDILQSRLPAELRGQVRIDIVECQMLIRATMAEHRKLEKLIEQLVLPLWRGVPAGWEKQRPFVGGVPVVG